VTHSAFLKDQ